MELFFFLLDFFGLPKLKVAGVVLLLLAGPFASLAFDGLGRVAVRRPDCRGAQNAHTDAARTARDGDGDGEGGGGRGFFEMVVLGACQGLQNKGFQRRARGGCVAGVAGVASVDSVASGLVWLVWLLWLVWLVWLVADGGDGDWGERFRTCKAAVFQGMWPVVPVWGRWCVKRHQDGLKLRMVG